jgi:hypothetical protein
MRARYCVLLGIAAEAALAAVFVLLWQWFRTPPGLYTLLGLGVLFQLTGVVLVIRDLRRGTRLAQSVDTYDRVIAEIEKMAGDIAPGLHRTKFKAAMDKARSGVVQDDLVAHARVVWISWSGPVVLTMGILLTGASAAFGFAPLKG